MRLSGYKLPEAEMANPIDFYFDYSSPYGYFAAMKIDGEPFWGVDRFDQIERWLAQGPY